VVAGYRGLLYSNKVFMYSSMGSTLINEPTNFFSVFPELLEARARAKQITDEERYMLKFEFMKRVRQEQVFSDFYRGEAFYLSVADGTRRYELQKIVEFVHGNNKRLMLLGTLLTFGGLFGFVVEARLRSVRVPRV
jgi:hypothetical protein